MKRGNVPLYTVLPLRLRKVKIPALSQNARQGLGTLWITAE